MLISSTHRRAAAASSLALLLLLFATLLSAPPPSLGAMASVAITDGAFQPGSLTISVGDTITWANEDDSPHTVTSVDGAFDSGNLDPGVGFSFTFREPGTYTYVCSYHEEMVATITVVADSTDAAAAVPAAATSAPAASAAPAASTAAVAAQATHAAGHGDDQPDTALGLPATAPGWVATLLIGLGLVAFAFGLVPPRFATTERRTGWRR